MVDIKIFISGNGKEVVDAVRSLQMRSLPMKNPLKFRKIPKFAGRVLSSSEVQWATDKLDKEGNPTSAVVILRTETEEDIKLRLTGGVDYVR
jgi:hypothetical protein